MWAGDVLPDVSENIASLLLFVVNNTKEGSSPDRTSIIGEVDKTPHVLFRAVFWSLGLAASVR
jgi:hypothetical protein